MKKILLLTAILMVSFLWKTNAQDNETTIKLRIEDADGKLIEKTYESEEALENDKELEEMGIFVEADKGRIKVRNEGESRVMITQHSGKGNVFVYSNEKFFNDSIPFPDAPPVPPFPPLIIRMDSAHFSFSDSFGEMPPMAFFRMHDRSEMDSLLNNMKHRRFEMKMMRDSLRMGHMQEMRAAQEEMRAEMLEMRQQMQEMRAKLHEERRYVVIENLSREEAEKLRVENQTLKLEELQFFPNPSDGELSIQFEAADNNPVQVKLTDAGGRTLYEQTLSSASGHFNEKLNLEGQESGVYILHIIQNDKVLSRKIMLK